VAVVGVVDEGKVIAAATLVALQRAALRPRLRSLSTPEAGAMVEEEVEDSPREAVEGEEVNSGLLQGQAGEAFIGKRICPIGIIKLLTYV
jgi:hypothetical protein